MDILAQYFDHYVISARIKPAFFVVLPLAATVIAWWPEAQQLGGAVLTFLVTFGAIGFLSNLISNRGNELQVQLFKEWGGAPTTILLRHGDGHLDPYTKERYHRLLEGMIPGLTLPSDEHEQANPSNADACYMSATTFLREHTRDKTKHPLVYADNVAYGYARNLLAMKPWGITSAALAMAVNIALLYPQILSDFQIEQASQLAATGVSMIMFYVFTFVVNNKYVMGRAVRYARSLLAVCDAAD